jgi:hypothetical protein
MQLRAIHGPGAPIIITPLLPAFCKKNAFSSIDYRFAIDSSRRKFPFPKSMHSSIDYRFAIPFFLLLIPLVCGTGYEP